jgi:hypothetical protein
MEIDVKAEIRIAAEWGIRAGIRRAAYHDGEENGR